MAKTKQKNHNEVEHLRGIIREQEKLIRSLRRRLKYLEKHQQPVEENDDSSLPEEQTHTCPECGKGNLYIVDLKYVVFEKCNICEYKKKIQNTEKEETAK